MMIFHIMSTGSSLCIRGQKDINDNDIPDVEFSSTRGYFIVKT